MLVYLSGSIEFAENRGRAWRTELTPFLRSLGHRVYDPAADERKNLTAYEVAHFRRWKTTAPEKFAAAVRKIIHWDLDMVEKRAACVVCYWTAAAGRGAGTQAEVTAAFRSGKPVYLVTALPPAEISGWILACATRVFRDFDELRGFFKAVQSPTSKVQSRKKRR